jgi:hypothetical protein
MRIDRRLTFIGILIVVLSMTMATQYATTRVGYSYSIVHPSNADIRFIGSDNSTDGRVLRVDGTNGSNVILVLEFGNVTAGVNKTYTSAFGIVNEEQFAVNITHINVSAVNPSGSHTHDYMQIYLHGQRNARAEDDSTSVWMWNNGTQMSASTSTAWTLAPGDQKPLTMTTNVSPHSAAGTNITTTWDDSKHVRFSTVNLDAKNASSWDGTNRNNSIFNASDFVWIQISLNVPQNVTSGLHSGAIFIHFEASTFKHNNSG